MLPLCVCLFVKWLLRFIFLRYILYMAKKNKSFVCQILFLIYRYILWVLLVHCPLSVVCPFSFFPFKIKQLLNNGKAWNLSSLKKWPWPYSRLWGKKWNHSINSSVNLIKSIVIDRHMEKQVIDSGPWNLPFIKHFYRDQLSWASNHFSLCSIIWMYQLYCWWCTIQTSCLFVYIDKTM